MNKSELSLNEDSSCHRFIQKTLMGKLPMGILQQSTGVPVYLIAGHICDQEEFLKAGFAHVQCITPDGISLEDAMRHEVAIQNISDAVSHILNL